MAQLRKQDPQQNSGQPIIESGAITCSAHVWYGLYRTSWWTCVVTRVCKHCSLWIWRILSLVQLVKLQGKSWGLITSHFHIGLQSPPRSIFAHHITLRWLCCVCVSAQESKLIVLWLKWRICTTFYPLPGVQCHASQLLPAQCMCPRLVRICGLPKGLQVQIGHVLFRWGISTTFWTMTVVLSSVDAAQQKPWACLPDIVSEHVGSTIP